MDDDWEESYFRKPAYEYNCMFFEGYEDVNEVKSYIVYHHQVCMIINVLFCLCGLISGKIQRQQGGPAPNCTNSRKIPEGLPSFHPSADFTRDDVVLAYPQVQGF